MQLEAIGEIDSTENGKVATDISFRESGLMRRPYKYGTVRTNLVDALMMSRGVTRLFVATGTDYENSELVYQGSANNNYTMIGYVHRTRDTVQVELTKECKGNITVGQALVGDNSGVSRIVTQITQPILNRFS